MREGVRRWLPLGVGLWLLPVALPLGVAALRIHASASGWGYVVGLWIVTLGLLSLRWRRRRGLTRAGLGLLLLVAASRLVASEGEHLRLVRLPEGTPHWANRLVSERDGTLFAAHALVLTRSLPRSDSGEFLAAMETAFDRLDGAGGVSTPAVSTYLGMQSPAGFDAVVIPARGKAAPEVAVVFLHGYAGNFAVYCWQMAQAAWAIDALTVCPSVGPSGAWGTANGARTLDATLDWVASQGIRRVYLGGLSNGGLGASLLVNDVAHPRIALSGLVLISGASSKAPIPRVPTLVVQGRHDTMMPTRDMRTYVASAGRVASYVEVDSGHFAFLDRRDECERAIATWLVRQEKLAGR
ncbi:alpha/beta hydrolase [Myxococcus landrumensis]|uniref:Alpha/beta hydrolase n=1 Tax=Myxococcus landrumensis TaxID=2813577 RepID=A0ABX7NLV7_9BACT|nr:alpha/beta hydrolase [Myxococcus landrumus]